MPMPSVCVIGSLNMDLVVRSPRIPGPGETVLGGAYRTFPGGKARVGEVVRVNAPRGVKMFRVVEIV